MASHVCCIPRWLLACLRLLLLLRLRAPLRLLLLRLRLPKFRLLLFRLLLLFLLLLFLLLLLDVLLLPCGLLLLLSEPQGSFSLLLSLLQQWHTC